MARRHHRRSEENPEWRGVTGSGGNPNKCAFYFYNGRSSVAEMFFYNFGCDNILNLEVSSDGENWTPIPSTSTWGNTEPTAYQFQLPSHAYLYIRNTSETPTGFSNQIGYYTLHHYRNLNIGGNIKSLLCKYWNKNIPLTPYCFQGLFDRRAHEGSGGNSLIQWTAGSSDPDHVDFVMPFDTLAPYCYYQMFYGNRYDETDGGISFNHNGNASTKSNVLVLQGDMSGANACFAYMFRGCEGWFGGSSGDWIDMSGISGIMPGGAFQSMFAGCTQLVYANHVIYGLDWYFGGGGIAGYGMNNMFANCTSLQEFVFSSWGTPAGGFTYKGVHYEGTQDQIDDVFMDIFESRAGAGVARGIYGAEVAMQCMFLNCVSLAEAWLPPYCRVGPLAYSGMYSGCTNLTKLGYFHGNPILPAGIPYSSGSHTEYNALSASCYDSMFSGCSNLMEAPILPAETLAEHCYQYMFQNCTNIVYIKMLGSLEDYEPDYYMYNWLYGCEKQTPGAIMVIAGTSAGANSWSFSASVSGLPSGWTMFNTYTEPLWFKNIGTTTPTISLTKASSAANLKMCWFTETNQAVTARTISATTSTNIAIPRWRRIFFQCPTGYTNTRIGSSSSSYWRFTANSGSHSLVVGGQISTLVRPNGLANSGSNFSYNYFFYRLFYSMTTLKYAQELDINSYASLTGGLLGSSSTYIQCYMFQGCTALKYPPAHLGGTLYSSGTSVRHQFSRVFYNCTSLRESPILAPITINRHNYYQLFYCASAGNLKKVTALFTNTPGNSTSSPYNYGTYQWLYNQNQEGIFYKASSATWTDVGDYAVPASFDIDTNTYRNQFVNHHPNWIYYLVEKKPNSDPE